jgi:outer membrane receptor protein involved in Fe transport
VLLSRLNDVISFTNAAQPTIVEFRPEMTFGSVKVRQLTTVQGITMNEAFQNTSDVYSGEVQQIFETSHHSMVVGARLQYGTFGTLSTQDIPSTLSSVFPPQSMAVANQDLSTFFNRITLYGYHSWHVVDGLELVGGVTYDSMKYPSNVQNAPISDSEESTSQLSPKAGIVWNPCESTAIQFAYTRSMGGVSIDQSYQLEPSQVAGLLQSYRSIIPESVAAESPGTRFETYDISMEQKVGAGTYIGLEGDILNSRVDEDIGAFEVLYPEFPNAVPVPLFESLRYTETALRGHFDQLLGSEWTAGATYVISEAVLDSDFPEVQNAPYVVDFEPQTRQKAILQNSEIYLVYNSPSGFFSRAEALWNRQSSTGYSPVLAGDDFWQYNLFVGYRFLRRHAEVRFGLFNVSDQNYNLNPLNLHPDYSRRRTFDMRLRLNF